ncbi:ferrous iron transport protein B [bacterium SCSIO 12741]|nr:ferrous iron transport protein B [bacterium SCSIO 12741]
MSSTSPIEVVLAGNPNSGKTSLFNRLTGMNQRTGNYPGITVDHRSGSFVHQEQTIHVTDLPGIYSLYPGSDDERIGVERILEHHKESPDTVYVCLVEWKNPHKNLLILSQLLDLGIPVIGAFNYRKKSDIQEVKHWIEMLKKEFDIPFIPCNAETGEGVNELKNVLSKSKQTPIPAKKELEFQSGSIPSMKEPIAYSDWVAMCLAYRKEDSRPPKEVTLKITQDLRDRLERIDLLKTPEAITREEKPFDTRSNRLDKLLVHPFWGYVLFGVLLLLVFQSVFSWASYPMDWIDAGFAWLGEWSAKTLPSNWFTRAITDGIIPGIGGIVIFVPQIALLFLFIALFEESGYMSRVVYLMDRLVKPFGLSGRSVVPLISGYACAIPAIMATRTLKHPREKLITMLVIPFMTCSARIPVYATLIALLVSPEAHFGPFNIQGLLLLGLYFFGAFISFLTAWIISKLMKSGGRSMLLLELPDYKVPGLRNVTLTMFEKSRSFVVQAGKVILIVSLILYIMSSVGFNSTFQKIQNNDPELTAQYNEQELAQLKLENSLIGQAGKFIEPAIKPLGYDWKIGISLITSFAAREVFVGTLSTIYALEDAGDDVSPIVEKLREDKNEAGEPVYSLAVILSLLVFYALAMQCISTLAVMKKETGGWKWPMIQLGFMTASAYVLALITFQVFS